MPNKIEDCWYKGVCKEKCNDKCIRYLEMKYLMSHSGLPKAKQYPVPLRPAEIDVPAFEQLATIKDDIFNYVQNGKNLYITSRYCGNGKTTWAIKLLLKYFDEVWAGNGFRIRGVFVHVPTFFMQMKNNISDRDEKFIELRDSLMQADLVVWDEVGNSALTRYEFEQFLAFIDYRLLAEKSNIYTSNITAMEGMQRILGVKLASRIFNGSDIVELQGKDMRDGSVTIHK